MSFIRPTSVESEVSCDTNIAQDAPQESVVKCSDETPRTQRSISIPVMATSALSDISERSVEPDQNRRPPDLPEESSPDGPAYHENDDCNINNNNNNDDETNGDGQGGKHTVNNSPSKQPVNVEKETNVTNERGECTTEGGETVAHANPQKR